MKQHVEKDPLIGTLFNDRYLINFLVAKGGMGNIYQAHDTKNGRIVAIKMLRAEFSDDQIILRRFERETDAVSCLKHPNICQLFDSGCTPDGTHFFTMEYLEGEALDQILRVRHVLEPAVAVQYMLQVAAGLCDAHNHGIVHRDLKPANIFIVHEADEQDMIKVLDFGVAKVDDDVQQIQAKLTRAGATLGTPFYMSPEQIQGHNVDGRTDVYAAGVILWECLFGMPPFVGRSLMEIFNATMNGKLPRLPAACRKERFWKDVYKILSKALQKDADKRYRSMQDFMRALETLTVSNSDVSYEMRQTPRSLPTIGVLNAMRKISVLHLALIGTIVLLTAGLLVTVAVYLMPGSSVESSQTRVDTYKFYSDIPADIIVDSDVIGVSPVSVDLSQVPPFSVKFVARYSDYTVRINEHDGSQIIGYAVNLAPKKVDKPRIVLETMPEGAEVLVNGQRFDSTTPCDIPAPGAEQFILTVRQNGYRDEVIYVVPNGGDVKITTNLFVNKQDTP